MILLNINDKCNSILKLAWCATISIVCSLNSLPVDVLQQIESSELTDIPFGKMFSACIVAALCEILLFDFVINWFFKRNYKQHVELYWKIKRCRTNDYLSVVMVASLIRTWHVMVIMPVTQIVSNSFYCWSIAILIFMLLQIVSELIYRRKISIHRSLVSDVETTDDIELIEKYVKAEHPDIRFAVAKNKNCPIHILKKIAEDEAEWLIRDIARRQLKERESEKDEKEKL